MSTLVDDQRVVGTEYHMHTIKTISLVLVIVGALNWLLVGLFSFDLVAAITGTSFGGKNALSSIVYVLVGLAGLVLLPSVFGGERTTQASASAMRPR
ncbi:MAG TPA: DUF378 domain-containing protein [Trueperaceae bacterium]|nr:DUF378 domain-containing protein [Trueperaceae bacterium]